MLKFRISFVTHDNFKMTPENLLVICERYRKYAFLAQKSIYFSNLSMFFSYMIYFFVKPPTNIVVEKKCNSKSTISGPFSNFDLKNINHSQLLSWLIG